jgi:hypothetical protein
MKSLDSYLPTYEFRERQSGLIRMLKLRAAKRRAEAVA